MVTPTDALLSSTGGDFFLTLFSILFLFVVGLCGWLVYRMPKEWEAATNRIVAQLVLLMDSQKELKDCYKEHDLQAKEILKLNEKIQMNLESRPCNGKH